MTDDLWMPALIMAGVVLAIWHGRFERHMAIERCKADLRGERELHREMERNLLRLRDDSLAHLRAAKAAMADTLNENDELRRRLMLAEAMERMRAADADWEEYIPSLVEPEA